MVNNFNISLTFVEPSISILTGFLGKNSGYLKRQQEINENLLIFRPSGCLRVPKSIDIIDIFGLNSLYERMQLISFIEQADVIWLGSPIFYPLVKKFRQKILVFDRMDDYSYLTTNYLLKRVINKFESMLLKKSDIIFNSSVQLLQSSKAHNEHSYLVNNGIDLSLLKFAVDSNVTKEIKKIKSEGKVIFGYIGAVDHWFDYEVIDAIINKSSKFTVCIIGRDNIPEQRINHPNIHYFQPVPKHFVGPIIDSFDICLYPFINEEAINTINPVKIYEYLSFNKKVLAVKSKETEKFPGLYLYNNINEFNSLLGEILSFSSPFNAEELKEFTYHNSWTKRAEEIVTYLKGVKKRDTTSVSN
ncbi:glycosyl transferase [Paenibacillus lactis]|nr:glycosyl transferase [Paenibacillus lactis]